MDTEPDQQLLHQTLVKLNIVGMTADVSDLWSLILILGNQDVDIDHFIELFVVLFDAI